MLVELTMAGEVLSQSGLKLERTSLSLYKWLKLMCRRGSVIGVVAIGRNEGERLVACLQSVSTLGLPMVYVDSASTDGSQAIAREVGAVVVDLDLARPFTAARARHEGAQTLLAAVPGLRYVQFIDGDCVLVPAWIRTAQKFLDAMPDYAIACGRRRERAPFSSPYNQLADLEWATPVGDAPACGGDALIRVTAYSMVGGFDASLIAGEEPELCSRLRMRGWRVRRLDEEMTIHDAAMLRLSQWWRRAVRSGLGYAQAWWVTRDRRDPLYRRELIRAMVWATGPAALSIVVGTFIHPYGWLSGTIIYAAQITRLAIRFGAHSPFSWRRAGLLTLGKIAEAWGALIYVKRALTGTAGNSISYK